MKKLLILFFCLFMILAATPWAFAEPGRIVTPGGKLNMRKSPQDKARLVAYIPNHSKVEVVQTAEEWSQIRYQNKDGYVKTEFLRCPSQLPGQTVYADEGPVMLLESPEENAPCIRPVHSKEPISIESITGVYALVRVGKDSGYIHTDFLSFQYDKPTAPVSWVPLTGAVIVDAPLYSSPGETAFSSVKAGEQVTVTATEGDFCLVITAAACGYLQTTALCLIPPIETSLEDFDAEEAFQTAQKALKKRFKAFDPQELTYQVRFWQASESSPRDYLLTFSDVKEQLLFSALLDGLTGEVIHTGSYDRFASPDDRTYLLPDGECTLSLNRSALHIGQVLDVQVTAWTRHACRYSLTRNGKSIFEGTNTDHFKAAYRPREAGTYELTVTVTDARGLSATCSAQFAVDSSLSSEEESIYSQKDGWWLDKPYRKSTLDQSGCAIFALSHALDQMGIRTPETHPTQLAKTFALCLTPDGTNNERLLREAAAVYPFKTARDLITNPKKIASLMNDGCLFSFSVARGHIALISEISQDGKLVKVIDSAPSATFERIVNTVIRYQTADGHFRTAPTPAHIPGARWYFETQQYGGLTYWMDLNYAARRGVRLIRP